MWNADSKKSLNHLKTEVFSSKTHAFRRLVSSNSKNGHIAINHHFGSFSIRKNSSHLAQIIHSNIKAKSGEIVCLEYSPDGSKLLVIYENHNMVILNAESKHYDHIGKTIQLKEKIKCVDWSADS